MAGHTYPSPCLSRLLSCWPFLMYKLSSFMDMHLMGASWRMVGELAVLGFCWDEAAGGGERMIDEPRLTDVDEPSDGFGAEICQETRRVPPPMQHPTCVGVQLLQQKSESRMRRSMARFCTFTGFGGLLVSVVVVAVRQKRGIQC